MPRQQDANRPRTEARFAVGTRGGPRSTIWKAWVQGHEAYVTSRMFGSDMKLSLHSSGACQWSCTDTWVLRDPQRRNADRHLVRWQIEPPSDNNARLVFRVEIPVSELRPVEPPKDKKKVFWVSNAPEDSTIRFLFYLTPAAKADPAPQAALPQRHLFSLRLRNSQWFVSFVDLISISAPDLERARSALRERVRDAGHVPEEHHRGSMFIQSTGDSPNGLLELCLVGAQQEPTR
jgi:hypothetical protein